MQLHPPTLADRSRQMPKKIRTIRIEGNIAYVPLTQGYEAVIDAIDADIVGQKNWHAAPRGNQVYAVAKTTIDGKSANLYLHKLLTKRQDGLCVDHIDRNGLNNRRSNLRMVTTSQNLMNSVANRRSKSGIRGVSYCKKTKKWVATLRVNKKEVTRLYTRCKAGAIIIRKLAERKFFGKFAFDDKTFGISN